MCFLSQIEPENVFKALEDSTWVEAMQEELLQFKIQKVWVLCGSPNGMKVIGTKWVFRNKRDERGIVIRNKARLVVQGYKQEEGKNRGNKTISSLCLLYGLYCISNGCEKCISLWSN